MEMGLASGASARTGATTARAQPDVLRQLAALLGVVRRDQRIVGRQTPTLAILLGREIVGRLEMPLEHLQLLAILETDQIVGMDRLLDRNGRLRPLGRGRRRV